MLFTWKIADQEELPKIKSLIFQSDDKANWNENEIKRRVIIPLFLEQLIVFYDKNGRLSGFLTYATMNGQSACHQAALGILPADWRSGDQLWVVDFFAPFGGAEQMICKLRQDFRGATDQPVRYFRLKTKQIRRAKCQVAVE